MSAPRRCPRCGAVFPYPPPPPGRRTSTGEPLPDWGWTFCLGCGGEMLDHADGRLTVPTPEEEAEQGRILARAVRAMEERLAALFGMV